MEPTLGTLNSRSFYFRKGDWAVVVVILILLAFILSPVFFMNRESTRPGVRIEDMVQRGVYSMEQDWQDVIRAKSAPVVPDPDFVRLQSGSENRERKRITPY